MSRVLKISENYVYQSLLNLPQIVFEVTDLCNLNCAYCCYGELYDGYDKREGKSMSFADVKTILDYLMKIWKENYIPGITYPLTVGFYGGEPLLNMPLIEKTVMYLENSKNTGKQFFFNMTTNALLLDKHMDFLVEKGIRLLISFDGDEVGQSYRVDAAGKNSFSRVYKNIQMLQEKYPDYFEKYVSFNSVLHNKNNSESVKTFLSTNFNKIPSTSYMDNYGVRKGMENKFKTMSQSHVPLKNSNPSAVKSKRDEINSGALTTMANYIFKNGNVFNTYNDLFYIPSKKKVVSTGTCLPFAKKMFVTVNGKILPCERIDQKNYLGLLQNAELTLNLQEIATNYNKKLARQFSQCKFCAANTDCTQCVYKIEESSKCPSFSTMEMMQKRENDCINLLRLNPDFYNYILDNVTLR